MSPPSEEEFLRRIQTDERFFIECCLYVSDRETNTSIPFRLNPVQSDYENRRSGFDIILKARKMGFSTRLIARAIWKCAFQQSQHAVLICQDKSETQKQLDLRMRPMVRTCVYPLGVEERKDFLIFPKTGSRIYIGTAGTKTFGRGADITFYHLSEAAHYADPTLVTGIEQACLPGAEGYIETTANGENFFKQWWSAAEKGEGRYKPVFYPWHKDPRYRIPGGNITDPTEDELRLMDAFSLDGEQLAWRRKTIKDMTYPDLFPQEYPASAVEAFLTSGRLVMDWVSLLKHEENCRDAKWIGYLRDTGEKMLFHPIPKAALHVWHMPEPRHVYVIGADIGEGIENGTYSVACVFDAGTGEQVAEWHGRAPPDRFGEILVQLATFYNTALLAPEAWPGPGATTMKKIEELGYRHYYRRQPRGNRTNPDDLHGWETTHRTKPHMCLTFAADLREYNVVIHSKGLLDELRSFVYNDDGDMIPQAGCYSDRVMAAGIANMVMREIAAGVHYDRNRLRDIERAMTHGEGLHVPDWKGPRYGVRPQ